MAAAFYSPGVPSAITPIILDWNALALPQVAQRLAAGAADGTLDLSDTCVVLPGARAGRLLLWHLADRARAEGLRVVPPRLATPGALADVLAPDRPREAAPLARLAAFAAGLRSLPPEALAHLLAAVPRSLQEWLAMAQATVDLKDRLGGEGVTFDAAAKAAMELEGDRLSRREAGRWEALAAAERAAAERLRASGLLDPIDARWAAATERTAPMAAATAVSATPRRVVLALVAELNALQRRVLARFADGGGRIEVMAHADDGWAARLDELGCVRVDGEGAASRPALVPDDELVVVEHASDAPQVALETIASLPAGDRPTVGLVDASLGPLLEQAGAFSGVAFRLAAGRALAATEPWATIDALADWAAGERDPSALARLPAAGHWLSDGRADGGAGLLEALDAALRPGVRRPDPHPLRAAQARLDAVLSPFADSPRPLAAWAVPVRALLAEVLAALDADPLHDDAVAALVEELAAWVDCPQHLLPDVNGAAALRLLAARLATIRLPVPVRRGEVEALGWLELHPDDASVLVLLGVHEGCVPRWSGADAFLPDVLLRALGMPDSAATAVRDEYLLAAMRRGRRVIRAVAARRSPSGDPLLASRLLLRVPAEELAARLRRIAGAGARRFEGPAGVAPPSERSRFVVPRAPADPVELDTIAVTAFRRYLQCPFHYWLERQLGLEALRPLEEQFDAAEFGTLAHAALARWGRDPVARDGRDPAAILAALEAALELELKALFPDGAAIPVPVLVQAARLRERFVAFAERQAAHRADGWRVAQVEWPLPGSAVLTIPPERPVHVTGRIDRIDRHETTGEALLIDYKTADQVKTPEGAHRARNPATKEPRWIDLQLPLYRHLAGEAAPRLAYFNLPRQAAKTGVAFADWGDDDIESAVDVARWVVQSIRRGAFVRNPDFAPRHDDFAAICQTRSLSDDGEGAP